MKRRGSGCGATLLEVALAMALMAICVLGQLSTQISLARHARAASERERAAFAADAIAEASRGSSASTVDRWKASVSSTVPQGSVVLADAGGDEAVVTLTWATTAQYNETPEAVSPDGCNGAPVAKGRACLALAFAK
jgi:Tfp pilus assembly protein PilV